MFKESKLSSSLRDESEGRVPQDWEDVQTNIYDIIAFATMAKHHRADAIVGESRTGQDSP